MTDFFTALEAELSKAAARRPRPRFDAGPVLATVAAMALVATATVVALAIMGGGDARSGEAASDSERPTPRPVDGKGPQAGPGRVVARGEAEGVGPWTISVSRTPGARDTRGAVMWHRGWCIWLTIPSQSHGVVPASSGFCGSPRTRNLGFRRTPGFSRLQMLVPDRRPGHVVLVWGRVPDGAARVVISAPNHRITVTPTDGLKGFPGRFFVIPVRGRLPGASINWLNKGGRAGSDGIGLMPPISR